MKLWWSHSVMRWRVHIYIYSDYKILVSGCQDIKNILHVRIVRYNTQHTQDTYTRQDEVKVTVAVTFTIFTNTFPWLVVRAWLHRPLYTCCCSFKNPSAAVFSSLSSFTVACKAAA